MATQQQKTITSGPSGGEAAARAVEPIADGGKNIDPVVELAASLPVLDGEQIARLAYFYWQARGCPWGSPEEDWFRAETELRTRAVGTGA